ncbi:hypothetical protein ENSA5_51470 [Enhygromyxa salina]|uniref:Peptidase C-terminal archaeal/bacterial domain-containing protein n=1 Tax=Enhygromyxa salina TaxID=215803 RepID=A0A2S9XH02_9BACT|nr:hypothetical protein [Enhygromyxa salina]PRP92107.1 hypothetical protein ENSA5_51470 [Enhygromyxa salina]
MRLRSLSLIGVAVLFAAGCGPGGPPGLEGFSDAGETGDGELGDGDGDGDGDGELGDCVDAEFGEAPELFFDGYLNLDFSSDHAGLCGPSPGPDYSIAWIAPQTSTYRASLFAEFPGWLTVLRGGCEGAFEGCAGFEFPTIVEFEAVAGEDYTFVIDTEDEGFEGYFEFSLVPVGGPGECPAGELSGTQDSVAGSTLGKGNGFESFCGGEIAGDDAYLFVPPVSGEYVIDMYGSDYDTMLHVFEGECGGPIVECNDDSFDSVESELLVYLEAGQIYTIVADGFGGSEGNYQLNLELFDGPPSLCDDVDILPSQVPVQTDWPVEADAGDLFEGCSFAPFERRWLWTAPADGIYRATQDAGPNPSGLALFGGGCEGNADFCEDDPPPSIVFDATAGQEILLVSEWQPDQPGFVNLRIEAEGGGGPGCGAALGPGVPTFTDGTTLGTGDDFSGSCGDSPAPEAEHWWTAPATGSYRISLEGSNYDTLMYVRGGGCEGPELACNDDTITDMNVWLWSTIDLELNAGQTISIFVDGYNGSGSYSLAITEL